MFCASQFPNYWTVAKTPSSSIYCRKNFQEEQLNSRRIPVFPEGISNSSRFPEVVDTLINIVRILMWHRFHFCSLF